MNAPLTLGGLVGARALFVLLALCGCAPATPTRGQWTDAEAEMPDDPGPLVDELSYLQGTLPALWLT